MNVDAFDDREFELGANLRIEFDAIPQKSLDVLSISVHLDVRRGTTTRGGNDDVRGRHERTKVNYFDDLDF